MSGDAGTVPGRSSGQVLGPNRSVVDDYPDIHQDPMWRQSDSPIPAHWYQMLPPEPVYVAPPPEPEPPPPPPPEYYLENQSLLVSARTGTWTNPGTGLSEPLPGTDTFYPFGPAASAVLDDGTMFVAVNMFASDNSPTGFVRMWHLDSQLAVLGVHDQPWGGGVDMGNVWPIALAIEDGKVLLLIDTSSGDM